MLPVRLPERFRFIRELGRGGMGAVYEAFDEERGASVAIKTLPSNDPLAIARFKREFRTLADLQHPNLVTLGELFCEEGQWAFSMELVPGGDIVEYVRGAAPLGEPTGDERLDADTSSLPLAPEEPEPAVHRSVVRASSRPPAQSYGDMDEARLRAVLGQLAAALAALHEAGKIHRDIKPSNVRVRDDGHLFVLDFGLAVELHSEEHLTGQQAVLGTPAYMAPEQAVGGDVSPAADMYSVGVVLFQALTGRLPFEGAPMQMMLEKQRREAPRALALAPSTPPDLDALCARLLSFDPKERPSAAAVADLSRRGELSPENAEPTYDTRGSIAPLFVGRAGELEVLAAALRKVVAREPATVILEAESGAGKSFLARRFIERLSIEHPEVVVVSGRCYENESVPYNLWDGAIESLASYWQRRPAEQAGMLVPMHIAPLVQTFPALQRVPTVSRAITRISPSVLPREVQRRAFSALREIFERLTMSAPLVLYLDDLQWADDDSLMLLGEVLRPPSPPPLLLLGVARPLADYPLVESQLLELLPRGAVFCPVPGLSQADAIELATSVLLRESPELVDKAESIAVEAGGHALFITELARHVGEAKEQRGQLSLEEALWARVKGLPPGAQSVVTVLSLAARPLPESIVLAAADLEPAGAARALSELRVGHFTRSSRLEGLVWLEMYHDRLRKAVVEHIDPASQNRVFERIAIALEGGRFADPNMLTEYWKGAGRPERAARYAEEAADKAFAALAFERAARLYGEAAGHAAAPTAERALVRKQAEALTNAGELGAAAGLLVRLSQGATAFEAIDLKRAAAELLTSSGRFEEGSTLLRETSRAVGERFPESPLAVLFWLLVTRAWLAARGLRMRHEAFGTLTAHETARINVLWSAAISFSMTDNVRGAYCTARCLVRALNAGDGGTASLALGMHVHLVASQGRRVKSRVARLLAVTEAMVAEDGRPIARAFLASAKAWQRYFVGDWANARTALAEAERMLADGVVGFRHQLAYLRTVLYRNLVYLGSFNELRQRIPEVHMAARRQNDLFTLASVQANPMLWVGLADDRPDEVDRQLAEIEATLSPSRFLLQHLYVMSGRCNLSLYANETRAAYERHTRLWRPLARSFLLRIQVTRIGAYELRARCALHLASGHPSEEQTLVQEAEACARRLWRQRLPCSAAHAELIRAQVAMLRAQREIAVPHFDRAIALYDETQMGLHAAAARVRLGEVVGGARGEELAASADAWALSEGIVNPGRLFQLIAPRCSRAG